MLVIPMWFKGANIKTSRTESIKGNPITRITYQMYIIDGPRINSLNSHPVPLIYMYKYINKNRVERNNNNYVRCK